MEFTNCYTWSDLDKGHKLKLMTDKIFEKAPYLKGKVSKGDIFEVVRIYRDEENRRQTIIKGCGMELMIPEGTDDYFYWKY